jgi:putative membrane protein insertion efficiency factor
MGRIQPAPEHLDHAHLDHAHLDPSALDPTSNAGDSRDGALGFAFRLYSSLLSPVLHAVSPSRCLYLPTCSEYAYAAIDRFGVPRGSWMALRRFARCHPWGKGGLDPVPERACSGCGTALPLRSGSGQKSADHLP